MKSNVLKGNNMELFWYKSFFYLDGNSEETLLFHIVSYILLQNRMHFNIFM